MYVKSHVHSLLRSVHKLSLLFKLTQFIYLQHKCMHACTHAHAHTHKHTHALTFIGRLSGFCSGSSTCSSKYTNLFGYRNQHICTQNSTYSQGLTAFMIFLKTFVNVCKNTCLKLYNTYHISQYQMYSS